MVWKRSATYLYKIWAFINRSLFTETHLVQPLRLMGTVTSHSCLQTHRQQLCLNCPSAWLDTNSDGRKINSCYPRQSCLEYRDVFQWRLFSKDFQKLRDCVQHCTLHNLLSSLSFVQNLSQTSDSKGPGPWFHPSNLIYFSKTKNLQFMCDSSAGCWELLRRDSRTDNEDLLTWAVVSALHIEHMASASSSVFFFTCNNCAAWMRGSRVSLAPLFIRFLSRSHSSSWLTLYLYKEVRAARTLILNYG